MDELELEPTPAIRLASGAWGVCAGEEFRQLLEREICRQIQKFGFCILSAKDTLDVTLQKIAEEAHVEEYYIPHGQAMQIEACRIIICYSNGTTSTLTFP